MGSYYIPSNKLKGESRILLIFTAKSLIYTAIGGLLGLILYFIFNIVGLKAVGLVLFAAFALLGYGVGTIKFHSNGSDKISKNVGGEPLDKVLFDYINFKKNRKVYTYAVPREEPDYTSASNPLDMLLKKDEKSQNTKEEKR